MNVDGSLNMLSYMLGIAFLLYVGVTFARNALRQNIGYAIRRLLSFQVTILLVIVLLVAGASSSVVFIQPQQIGVVVSSLTSKGYSEQPLSSGIHLTVPILEHVIVYPIAWQSYTMAVTPQEGATTGEDAITARTKDGQQVKIDCSLIFRIDPEQVVRLHINWQSRYIDEFIRVRARGIVRDQVAKYTVEEVNSTQRTSLERDLEKVLRQILQDEGLALNTFVLRNIAFSPEYAAAIEQKQVALEGKKRREYEGDQIKLIAQAEADAEITRAKAAAESRLTQSRAEAEALRQISVVLKQNPELLKYEYISKLSPNIKVMLLPNNVSYMLPPLDDATLPAATQPVTSTVSPAPNQSQPPGSDGAAPPGSAGVVPTGH